MVYPMLYGGGIKNLSPIPNIKVMIDLESVPCWSVGALLRVIPDAFYLTTNLAKVYIILYWYIDGKEILVGLCLIIKI